MRDDLGDRMKEYEGRETKKFLPMLPVCVRLDGKGFHNYTKGMDRPYDDKFINAMQETMKFLVQESEAKIGYTQSDEISLIFYSSDFKSQIFFDGKVHKMVSVLASMCTLKFNEYKLKDFPAYFDCRAWQVPNKEEAVNTLIWREQDATRNSISMAAQSMFSHRELQGMSSNDMQYMMLTKRDVNWNSYPSYFKRGTYARRVQVEKNFTAEELAKIPTEHWPKGPVMRSIVQYEDMPPLTKVTNRIEVVFDGAIPIQEKAIV